MKRIYSYVAIVVALIVVLGGAYWFMNRDGAGIIKDKGSNLSDYSAVFVNGGGIYFGKITKMDEDVMVLESVYNYGIVPAEDAAATTTTKSNSTTDQQTRPTLFDASKVGIAPANMYNINRREVILWYSLKNDSDVVKTIDEYQKKQ